MLPIDLDKRLVSNLFSLQLRSLPLEHVKKGGENGFKKKSPKGDKRIAI